MASGKRKVNELREIVKELTCVQGTINIFKQKKEYQ